MSFVKCFEIELQRLAPLFAAAETADKEFHNSWNDSCKTMDFRQYKQSQRYVDTLDHFHEARRAIDNIILTAIIQARLGDLEQLPTLFAYIALPGRYFRSGYQRANIWRFLKRLCLDDRQVDLLRDIVLRQIETAGPEFSEFSKTARKLNSFDFRDGINDLYSRSKKEYVRRRAKRLLERLDTVGDEAG
jgi:hypothetical protein